MSKTQSNPLYVEAGKLLAKDAKPYLLDFLRRLGVLEAHCKDWTVAKCYGVLFSRLRKQMGKGKDSKIGNHYKLWAVGIPVEHLKTLTKKEAHQMVQMMGSKKIV